MRRKSSVHTVSRASKQQCVLADGTESTSNGICEVAALVEGEENLIPFEDLPVECPIISPRKLVKKGNIVKFKDGGGNIMNIATKKKLRCIKRNGIYFIKIQIVSPKDIEENQGSGFSRPRYPPFCLASPQIPIHGIREPQQEWESVDGVGELCGECAQEPNDGDEVTDDENVQTPECMPCPKISTATEKDVARFNSHAVPILVHMMCCGTL